MSIWSEDRAFKMRVGEAQVVRDVFPGIHEVEAQSEFAVAKPILEGMPKGGCFRVRRFVELLTDRSPLAEFSGLTVFTFNGAGKLTRVQNFLAGPKADEVKVQTLDAIRKAFGGAVPGEERASKALLKLLECINAQDAEMVADCMAEDGALIGRPIHNHPLIAFPRNISFPAILIDPYTFYRGKLAVSHAIAKWFGMGMRTADLVFGPVALHAYHVMAYVDHDFSGLPNDAPFAKHAMGIVMVNLDPESGKIKLIAALPHDQEVRKWNSEVIRWLNDQNERAKKVLEAA